MATAAIALDAGVPDLHLRNAPSSTRAEILELVRFTITPIVTAVEALMGTASLRVE